LYRNESRAIAKPKGVQEIEWYFTFSFFGLLTFSFTFSPIASSSYAHSETLEPYDQPSIFDELSLHANLHDSLPSYSAPINLNMLTHKGNPHETVPRAHTPLLNPLSLLDPRPGSKRPSQEPDMNGSAPNSFPGISMSGMIERMHGIQDRSEQPQKRLKRDLDDGQARKKLHSSSMSSGSLLSERTDTQANEPTSTRPPPAVVDLTLGRYFPSSY